jgi:hypothetical protein
MLEVLEKEGVNLGYGRERIRVWKRQRIGLGGGGKFDRRCGEQEERDKG